MFRDWSQTLRLALAGAVAFPQPYPTVGAISIEEVEVDETPGGAKKTGKNKGKKASKKKRKKKKELRVIVRERTGPAQSTTRVIPVHHVTAIFFYTGTGNRVDDFEEGDWVLSPDINGDTIEEYSEGDSCPSGIVFVPEYLSLLTIREIAERAGSAGTPGWETYCECEN